MQLSKALISTLLLLLFVLPSAHAADRLFSGVYTADEYQSLSPARRTVWTAGFMDGLMISFMLADEEHMRLHDCAVDVSLLQFRAMFDQYISDKPEYWHESMNFHAFLALMEKGPCAAR